jgi:pyruvate/2-oxoglutarate dehydrogenase complex dihydrolipoamide acyltransferase (E2) component
MTPVVEVELPVVNANDRVACVTAWHAADGELVRAGGLLVSVETDKASFDVEAPSDGYVERVVEEGERVAVGAPLARLHSEPRSALGARSSPPAAMDAEAGVRATRAARELAAAAGIDLTTIEVEGLITRRDVERRAGDSTGDALRLEPHERRFAEAIRQGAAVAVPSFVSRPARAQPVLDLCSSYGRAHRCAVSPTDAFLQTAARVLAQFPRLNARRDPDGTVHPEELVRIALALDADDTTHAPTISGPAELSLREIAAWRLDAAMAARRDPGRPWGAPTFALSNLSGHGVELFVPLLGGGHVATLGIGGRGHGELDEWLLCLTFDHTVAGGGYAARFLDALARALEDPESD